MNMDMVQAHGNVGGVVGMIYHSNYDVDINKCNIIDSTITSSQAIDIAGIVGQLVSCGGSIDINECNVSGLEITGLDNEEYPSDYAVIGGIVGSSHSASIDVTIKKCNVDKLIINQEDTDSGSQIGGIYGGSNDAACIEDCNVTNSKLYSAGYYNMSSLGGIAGAASGKIINCNVIDSIIIADNATNVAGIVGASNVSSNSGSKLEMKGCNVTGTTLKVLTNPSLSSHFNIPGVAGLIATAMNENIIQDCNVENCTIEGKGRVAGAVGYAHILNAQGVTISKDTTITDISTAEELEALKNNSLLTKVKNAAGFIGNAYNLTASDITVDDVTITAQGSSIGGFAGYIDTLNKIENSSVLNSTITNKNNPQTSYASVAGFVGDIKTVNGEITGNKVQNTTITSDSDNTSGFIGTINSVATINNCTVENVTVENKNINSVQFGNVAGMVSYNNAELEIKDSIVKDSTIKILGTASDLLHAGGLVGFANNVSVSGTKVENTGILNSTTGNTGGIVGMTNYLVDETTGKIEIEESLTISNDVEVLNCTTDTQNNFVGGITGNGHTGGMLGFGKLIASGGKVTNTTITGTNELSDVGGVIGNSLKSSQLNNIIVSVIKVISASRAGGIAGFLAGDVTNCTVENSNISTTGETEEVGEVAGNEDVCDGEITNCTVIDTTVSGNDE